MTVRGDTRAAVLAKAVGAAAVLGVLNLMLGRGRQTLNDGRSRKMQARPSDDAHSRRAELGTYALGYLLALALTGAAFALVHWRWAGGTTALAVVFGLALAQAIVHFRCFLHVDLKRSARDDLQLILFSTLIVLLMVGGTLVVLFNLRMRMM